MKALKILNRLVKAYDLCGVELNNVNEAIKELEELQENKSLVKTLEKMNEEMIDLRKENQDLKESNKELLEGLISTQKKLEEWLEKCN